MGGPGETQIESDRRVLREQIGRVRRQLKKVVQTRNLHRQSRKKVPFPIVSLVGYTNAGKSTLFNMLTKAEVVAKDQLFATLDPTMRLIELPSGRSVILSDTVGFISNLPTELVAAFRATLEEVVEADVLLHVRDIAHPETVQQQHDVYAVLKDLLPEKEVDQRSIEVLNNIDQLDQEGVNELKLEATEAHLISALSGDGVESLLQAIDEKLQADWLIEEFIVPVQQGKNIAWLHEHGEILEQHSDKEMLHIRARISQKDMGRWQKMIKEISN
jgi:GTP-binding protein HflX